MQNFAVEIGGSCYEDVSQLLAVRIRDLGGILREVAPAASLESDDLRLVLSRTTSRAAYLRYIIRGSLASKPGVKGIELQSGGQVICRVRGQSAGTLRLVDV